MHSDKKWAVLYSTWCSSARDTALWISVRMDGIAYVFDVRKQMQGFYMPEYDNLKRPECIASGKEALGAKTCSDHRAKCIMLAIDPIMR